MKRFFGRSEDGASLVELLMGVGILGVVSLFAAQFFKRVEASEYEAKARAGAVSEISLYINSIERDFKLRDITVAGTSSPICTGKCKSFSIVRKVKVGASDGDMPVKYETVCESIPVGMRPKFKDPSTGIPFNFTAALEASECFRLAGCVGDTYPQLRIVLAPPAGASIPRYPRLDEITKTAKFPELTPQTTAAAGVIGAAACGESKLGAGAVGADRVTIEAAYINSEGKFRIEKREVSIPRSNVAKIQMLPAN